MVSSYRMAPLMNSAAPGRGEQHLAVRAPALLGGLDPERIEPPGQGGDALVGRENALAVGDQRRRDALQILAHPARPPDCRSSCRFQRLRQMAMSDIYPSCSDREALSRRVLSHSATAPMLSYFVPIADAFELRQDGAVAQMRRTSAVGALARFIGFEAAPRRSYLLAADACLPCGAACRRQPPGDQGIRDGAHGR